MTSNDLIKTKTKTKYTVKRVSSKRKKNIPKAGSVHKICELNDDHLNELFHINNFQMDLAIQVISIDKSVRSDTVQKLKDINSQSVTT